MVCSASGPPVASATAAASTSAPGPKVVLDPAHGVDLDRGEAWRSDGTRRAAVSAAGRSFRKSFPEQESSNAERPFSGRSATRKAPRSPKRPIPASSRSRHPHRARDLPLFEISAPVADHVTAARPLGSTRTSSTELAANSRSTPSAPPRAAQTRSQSCRRRQCGHHAIGLGFVARVGTEALPLNDVRPEFDSPGAPEAKLPYRIRVPDSEAALRRAFATCHADPRTGARPRGCRAAPRPVAGGAARARRRSVAGMPQNPATDAPEGARFFARLGNFARIRWTSNRGQPVGRSGSCGGTPRRRLIPET